MPRTDLSSSAIRGGATLRTGAQLREARPRALPPLDHSATDLIPPHPNPTRGWRLNLFDFSIFLKDLPTSSLDEIQKKK